MPFTYLGRYARGGLAYAALVFSSSTARCPFSHANTAETPLLLHWIGDPHSDISKATRLPNLTNGTMILISGLHTAGGGAQFALHIVGRRKT